MNRKKLLDQQSHCIALAKMHADEIAYRQQLVLPDAIINAYLGPIQAYLAEQDHIVWQLTQEDDQDS